MGIPGTPIGSPQAELRTDLRIQIGSPSTTEVPDATLDRFLVRALRHVNRWFPQINMSYFLTIANTQQYDITEGQNPMDIWPPSDSGWGDVEFPGEIDGVMIDQLAGMDLFNNPALLFEYYMKISCWKLTYQTGWEKFRTGNVWTVHLYPRPSSNDNRVYYTYTYDWEWDSLIDEAKEAILIYAEILCLNYLKNKQGKGKYRSVSSRGISVSMDVQDISDQIEDLRNRFQEIIDGHIVVQIERG